MPGVGILNATVGGPGGGGGSGRRAAGDIQGVREKAGLYHKKLADIASRSRTTAVMRVLTLAGNVVDIVASSDRIDKSFVDLARELKDRIAPSRAGVDAEQSAVGYLESLNAGQAPLPGMKEDLRGGVPLAIGVYGESTGAGGAVIEDARAICGACRTFLTDRGRYGGPATISADQRSGYWPWYYSP